MSAGSDCELHELFTEAAKLTGEARREFVDRVAPPGTSLRHRLELLLTERENTPTVPVAPSHPSATADLTVATPRPRPPGDEQEVEAGTLLDERYRVLESLGKGGMGEVFRAVDTELGETVALKMLPKGIGADRETVRELHREVRVMRRVTHPGVCRVYDVGATDDGPFITMEYVDGEDLDSLLRRIGYLPQHKALEVASQICASLAAVHAAGVLHRDLKPSNIMLDGSGNVRLMDFGISIAGGRDEDVTLRGTPAYMAPELFSDDANHTLHSEVYALGLVLYELFTGQRAVQGTDLADIIEQHHNLRPTPPSKVVTDLSPAIERVIMQCLEKSPEDRFDSVQAVALALPGDTLSMLVDAGDTPSPELLASIVDAKRPTARSALFLAGGILLAYVLTVFVSSQTHVLSVAQLDRPTGVLFFEAQEHLVDICGISPTLDRAQEFKVDLEQVDYVVRTRECTSWQEVLDTAPSPFVADYFASDGLLDIELAVNKWTVRNDLLAADHGEADTARVRLDSDGRLRSFIVHRAPGPDVKDAAPLAESWKLCFGLAGLDIADYESIEPARDAIVATDEQLSWQVKSGLAAPGTEVLRPVRVDAGWRRGTPNYFRVLYAWELRSSARAELGEATEYTTVTNTTGHGIVSLLLIVFGFVAAIIVACRNLLRGRADLYLCGRLAAFIVLLVTTIGLLSLRSAPSLPWLLSSFIRSLSWGLFYAFAVTLSYVGLEPYLRHHYPSQLISWIRLWRGRAADPLVQKHVLCGVLAGLVANLFVQGAALLSPVSESGLSPIATGEWVPGGGLFYAITNLSGERFAFLNLLRQGQSAIVVGTLALVCFSGLKLAVRSKPATHIGYALIAGAIWIPVGDFTLLTLLVGTAMCACHATAFARAGILPFLLSYLVCGYAMTCPPLMGGPAWATTGGWAFAALLVGVVAYALRVLLRPEPQSTRGEASTRTA